MHDVDGVAGAVFVIVGLAEWRRRLAELLGRSGTECEAVVAELRAWGERWRIHARARREDGQEWRSATHVSAALHQLAEHVGSGDWIRELDELMTCLARVDWRSRGLC